MTASGKSTLSLSEKSSAEFTYSADGERTEKKVSVRDANGKLTSRKTTEYRYNNGMLLSETKGTLKLRYNYDINGRVVSLVLINSKGTELSYFLSYNGQGDVVAIYRSSDGALMGTYEYDLWGKPGKTTRTDADKYNITERNPIRHCSYYYDTETGLYYLNARYYDPTTRRFLNADSLAFMGGTTAVSYNLYAYCQNNPVNMKDSEGCVGEAILALGITGISIPEPITTVMGMILIAVVLIEGTRDYEEEVLTASIAKCIDGNVELEYRLPSWDKVSIDINHTISGHTSGGGRGDNNKSLWPKGMTASMIEKAIQEAYRNAEKAGSLQYSWKDGAEQVKQFFVGVWNDVTVQFWFNYTTNTIETAWPKYSPNY